jgi:alkanesulfonate monooxygenase SsuD/methylene tetrahydromethanopterin reductase-like flavin-dependent oxidoreductase (luciferase family)
MELGLLYEFEAPQPWDAPHPWGQRNAERKGYHNAIEQIVHADKKGFHTAWLVEHHFREGRSHMPCSEAVLGALSQITRDIRLGFGVTLTPHEFIHPARVAEKVATVDLLSNGRVEWGIGRSTPMEQTAFGVDIPRSKEKMLAATKTVVGMWAEEYYEEDSEFLKFPRRMVTPKPWQDPHPPVWLAASSHESARFAGENGLGLLCFSIMEPLSKIREVVEVYRDGQSRARPLTGVTQNKIGAYTLVHCAKSRDDFERNKLWDSMWWWYTTVAQFLLKWEFADFPDEVKEKAFPLLKKQADGDFDITQFDREDMVIVGTPDECLEKFLRYEEAGLDQVLCYVNFGHLTHEAVLESIGLLGDYVIPELKKAGAKRMAANLETSVATQARAQ